MIKLSLITFFSSYFAFAQLQIQVVDPSLESTYFEERHIVNRTPKVISHLPQKEKRDQVLNTIQLPSHWDELNKDIFFVDLQTKTIKDLLLKYPEIEPRQLEKLKDRIE
jgi:hypothetical protein